MDPTHAATFYIFDRLQRGGPLPLIGRSKPMQSVYRVIARIMNNDLTVLVEGESGTGKDLAARAIPRACSDAQVSCWGLMAVALLLEPTNAISISSIAREIGLAVARAYMPDAGLWDWARTGWDMVVPHKEAPPHD